MRVFEGKGRESDRGGALMAVILQAINEHAEGMTVVSVIGCLEMAKVVVMTESEGD